MEVIRIEGILFRIDEHIEVPRKQLQVRLTKEEKDIIMDIFIKNKDAILSALNDMEDGRENYLILTEPLCSLDIRKKIFSDLSEEYGQKGKVILKLHPRDEMDYEKEFPHLTVIEKMVPMEILNFMADKPFDKVISVLTDLNGVEFAKEGIRLGPDFMDKYEAPEIHRQNEQI